jgi:hypothetical protein
MGKFMRSIRIRMRRDGSFKNLMLGARSIHSHSRTHLRKIARRSASNRLTVALLHPSACLVAVIESIRVLSMDSSSKPAK